VYVLPSIGSHKCRGPGLLLVSHFLHNQTSPPLRQDISLQLAIFLLLHDMLSSETICCQVSPELSCGCVPTLPCTSLQVAVTVDSLKLNIVNRFLFWPGMPHVDNSGSNMSG
jgi:hypothetical protein